MQQGIVIRDKHDFDGNGTIVAHQSGCRALHGQHPGLNGGYIISDHRHNNLRTAVRAFKNTWSVDVDVRLCDCLTGSTHEREIGAYVDYTGSLTERHGRYMVEGICECDDCIRYEDQYGPAAARQDRRYELTAWDNGRVSVLHHVRPASFTVAAMPVNPGKPVPMPEMRS